MSNGSRSSDRRVVLAVAQRFTHSPSAMPSALSDKRAPASALQARRAALRRPSANRRVVPTREYRALAAPCPRHPHPKSPSSGCCSPPSACHGPPPPCSAKIGTPPHEKSVNYAKKCRTLGVELVGSLLRSDQKPTGRTAGCEEGLPPDKKGTMLPICLRYVLALFQERHKSELQ